jgi:hypothetical protein
MMLRQVTKNRNSSSIFNSVSSTSGSDLGRYVPNSSRPGPLVSSSREGGDPKPSISDNAGKGEDTPSTLPGTSFQIRRAAFHPFDQDCTWGVEVVSYNPSVVVNAQPFCRLICRPRLGPRVYTPLPGRPLRPRPPGSC